MLEEGAASAAAYQTKQMTAMLGLNSDEAQKVQAINLNHATEVERAKAECGDDYESFNTYVDKVAFVRDQELKSVLTPEQFATYTNKKSDETWLGMDKFKFRSEELMVKGNKHELKIKGKSDIATEDISVSNQSNQMANPESSDAYSNQKNIIVTPPIASPDSAVSPDYHNIPKDDATPSGTMEENAGVPERKTYPGEINVEQIYGVKPEYDTIFKPDSGMDYGNSSVDYGNKCVKTTANAESSDSSNFSSGQTLEPAPNSDDFIDTTTFSKGSEPSDYGSNTEKYNNSSSPKPEVENYFIDKNSKGKFSEDEIKVKPEKGVKYKITEDETKLKDGGAKVKDNENEGKIKDGDGGKVKISDHELKVKTEDLKVKIKE